MALPNPWADLRERTHITLLWADLPRGVHGLTDGHATIWLDNRLSQRERRCALMHELVHIDRGHTSHQPRAVETSVHREVARRLLPDITAIADAIASSDYAHDVTEHLWVTDAVLEARLEHLHPAERAYLHRRFERLRDP